LAAKNAETTEDMFSPGIYAGVFIAGFALNTTKLWIQCISGKSTCFSRLKKDTVWVELERSGGKAKAREFVPYY
jgi:hypothetical protein